MAEYRPYRVINASAQTRLTQMKLVSSVGLHAAGAADQLVRHANGGAGYSATRASLGPAGWRSLRAVGMDRLVVALAWVDRNFSRSGSSASREAAYPLLVFARPRPR